MTHGNIMGHKDTRANLALIRTIWMQPAAGALPLAAAGLGLAVVFYPAGWQRFRRLDL